MASISDSNADSFEPNDPSRSLDDFAQHHFFQNVDDPNALPDLLRRACSVNTKNFVVEFGQDDSFAAFDLDAGSVNTLLDMSRPPQFCTRWINVWLPAQQHAILQAVAKHYDFSPRLLSFMLSHPQTSAVHHSQPGLRRRRRWHTWRRHDASSLSALDDAETADTECSMPLESLSVPSQDSIANTNLYKIVDDVWHYSVVDMGRKYLSVGYNTLYETRPIQRHSHNGPLPHCKRLWTWLVLCDDGSVISINEDPFPDANGKLDENQQRVLSATRRNFLNVFRALSTVEDPSFARQNPLAVLMLRNRLGSTPEEMAHFSSDAPGLLFYYLFENWHNVASLTTRRESRYGKELDALREKMLHRPELSHIERLHALSGQLGVLRRHFQSHQRIIDRVLDPIDSTQASLQNSRVIADSDDASSLNTVRVIRGPVVSESASRLGVSLSSAARVRFRRLRDMIDLYALSEVEEYLKQKDALVSMNFNLIAINESRDVEKLTRITLLLTKFTILFLPVSLMTSYFGTDLQSQEYTVKQFWVSFASILAGSWLLLVSFGVYSDSLQTTKMFQAGWRRFKSAWTRVMEA